MVRVMVMVSVMVMVWVIISGYYYYYFFFTKLMLLILNLNSFIYEESNIYCSWRRIYGWMDEWGDCPAVAGLMLRCWLMGERELWLGEALLI